MLRRTVQLSINLIIVRELPQHILMDVPTAWLAVLLSCYAIPIT